MKIRVILIFIAITLTSFGVLITISNPAKASAFFNSFARGFSPTTNVATNTSFIHSSTANLYIAIGIGSGGTPCPGSPSFFVSGPGPDYRLFTLIDCLPSAMGTTELFYYKGTIPSNHTSAQYVNSPSNFYSAFIVTAWENANVSFTPITTPMDYNNTCDVRTGSNIGLTPTLADETVFSSLLLVTCGAPDTNITSTSGNAITGIGNGNCWPFPVGGSICLGVGYVGDGANHISYTYPGSPSITRHFQWGVRFKSNIITVNTLSANNIQIVSAVLHGSLYQSSSVNFTVGFYITKNSTFFANVTAGYRNSTSSFSYQLNNLTGSTLYRFKAWIINDDIYKNGTTLNFTTGSSSILVATGNFFIILIFMTIVILFFMVAFWVRRRRGIFG